MHDKAMERRLAAIMVTDVVGYSRLMGEDEAGTLRALKAIHKEQLHPALAGYHGRIVKSTGDGLLLEFASAVDAVACAVTFQRGVAAWNAAVSDSKRVVFRIGINVGDIIADGDDILGNGVNVAARLEGLCEPGGLCASRTVRDHVRDKLPIEFADLGEQTVKNIKRPVRVFGLSANAILALPDMMQGTKRPVRLRPSIIAAGIAAILLVGGVGVFFIVAPPPVTAPQSVRASIAVLPLTGDGDDYFADGLTEDIISALGRFRELSVISRSAIFSYRGKGLEEVARDLKVRYVVEGSVRRTPERIRVQVSLVDTTRGTVLWSDRYDAKSKEVFAVQDQITRRITGALAVRVTSLELAQSAAKPANDLEAYDLVLRGREMFSRATRVSQAEARGLFERAIELDPQYAPGYVGLGQVDLFAVTTGLTPDPGVLERAEQRARMAISIDDLNAGAHALLGEVLVSFGDYDQALETLRRAVGLNGSDAEAHSAMLVALLFTGDIPGAISAGELLVQLQPDLLPPQSFYFAMAYLLGDRTNEAIRLLEGAATRGRTNRHHHPILAAAYAAVSRTDDAAREAEITRRAFPKFSASEYGSLLRRPEHRDKFREALQQAGRLAGPDHRPPLVGLCDNVVLVPVKNCHSLVFTEQIQPTVDDRENLRIGLELDPSGDLDRAEALVLGRVAGRIGDKLGAMFGVLEVIGSVVKGCRMLRGALDRTAVDEISHWVIALYGDGFIPRRTSGGSRAGNTDSQRDRQAEQRAARLINHGVLLRIKGAVPA